METPSHVWVKPKRAKPPHPTALKLLEATIELLDQVPIDAVTLAMVLERSQVSQGSIYHHFEDLPNLVEEAAVHRYTRGLKESLAVLATLLDSTDAADFRQRAEVLLVVSNQQERRSRRMERLDVLGALRSRPRLAAAVGRAQHDVLKEQAGYLAEAQRRGWIRADVDPMALSTLLAAMTFGRVVDDVSERPIDADLWTDIAVRAVFAVAFPD